MPTPRETIFAALHARLSALPVTTLRGEVLPERVPVGGLLILRDGEPGEPEVTLSPLAYHYQHRAEIEAVVQGADRDAAFDTLIASIGAALAADRTLGGLCDWVEAEAPRPVDLPVEGAASLKAAVIPVVLHYTLLDPLAEAAPSPAESSQEWPGNTVALWLIFGQSNAEGYAPWRQDPAKADPAQAVAFLSAAERAV
ncbi:hypothetical protein LY05_03010, partial [Oceanicella actignis]